MKRTGRNGGTEQPASGISRYDAMIALKLSGNSDGGIFSSDTTARQRLRSSSVTLPLKLCAACTTDAPACPALPPARPGCSNGTCVLIPL